MLKILLIIFSLIYFFLTFRLFIIDDFFDID